MKNYIYIYLYIHTQQLFNYVHICIYKKIFSDGGQIADKITLSIMYMISVDKLPLSTVQSRGFKILMKTVAPLYSIPSRKTLTNLLETRYNIMKEQFKEKIKKALSYTLTCDNWTDCTNQSYLGVTIHTWEPIAK